MLSFAAGAVAAAFILLADLPAVVVAVLACLPVPLPAAARTAVCVARSVPRTGVSFPRAVSGFALPELRGGLGIRLGVSGFATSATAAARAFSTKAFTETLVVRSALLGTFKAASAGFAGLPLPLRSERAAGCAEAAVEASVRFLGDFSALGAAAATRLGCFAFIACFEAWHFGSVLACDFFAVLDLPAISLSSARQRPAAPRVNGTTE